MIKILLNCLVSLGCPFYALSQSALWLLVALTGSGMLGARSVEAQGLITSPIQVRLHWQAIDNSTTLKLGIHASIGDSPSPQIFEFDTGGAGFFATYSSHGDSPWWGSSGWSGSTTAVRNKYGSGLDYEGFAATGTVNLFDSATAVTAKLQVSNVELAQTTRILDTKTNERLWPLPSQSSVCPNKPPTECGFWGDFGMALKTGKTGSVRSLITQSAFWAGFDPTVVTPGYRVHGSGSSPWVQFGLGAADLAAAGSTFVLNQITGQVSGGVTVTYGSSGFPASASSSTPLLFDTGAFPTLHAEDCDQSSNPPDFPSSLTLGQQCESVIGGAQVVVSGLTTTGQLEPFWRFQAGQGPSDINLALKVKDKNTDGYYLNTGLLPFEQFDVIVNLDPSTPQLTLVPVPVPGFATLASAAGALGFARRLRRRIHRH